MASATQPSALSIQIADAAAKGHINAGLEQYRTFSDLSHQSQAGGQLDVQRVLSSGISAVTNLSLGVELLCKIHHFQVTGQYPRGHDLRNLGRSLPPETIENLSRIYQGLYSDPNLDQGLELRYSFSQTQSSPESWEPLDCSTYLLAIDYVGPMYVRWRYIYEEFHDQADIRVTYQPLYLLARTFDNAISNYAGNTKITMKYCSQ